ncbi:DUF402 domain-containing protein [Streptomyces sp. NPDC090108]|uniref:DUF402 domain-containing protein n=1 Tax=Streptomyces sp. NPDC090108 TaxID=3365947 RepID=UPI00382EED1A
MYGTFDAGTTIVHREILDGAVWLSYPMTVVSDGPVLAAYLARGTPLTFGTGDFRWGPHPWTAMEPYWLSDGVLQLQRPGDGYAVWMRREGGEFSGWYVNFQEPMRRTADGFDTLDQELDLWIPGDGKPYSWKDVEEFEERERSGGFLPGEAAGVRRAAGQVEELIARGACWWEEWRHWSAPQDWDRDLPAGTPVSS